MAQIVKIFLDCPKCGKHIVHKGIHCYNYLEDICPECGLAYLISRIINCACGHQVNCSNYTFDVICAYCRRMYNCYGQELDPDWDHTEHCPGCPDCT